MMLIFGSAKRIQLAGMPVVLERRTNGPCSKVASGQAAKCHREVGLSWEIEKLVSRFRNAMQSLRLRWRASPWGPRFPVFGKRICLFGDIVLLQTLLSPIVSFASLICRVPNFAPAVEKTSMFNAGSGPLPIALVNWKTASCSTIWICATLNERL